MTATSAIPPVDTYRPGIVTKAPDGSVTKLGNILLIVGAIALAVSYLGLLLFAGDTPAEKKHMTEEFYFSYLTSYMFTLSLGLGALFFVVVQHVARAGWSVVVRRVAENMSAALPAMLVLFIPLVLGGHTLYHHWMDADLNPKSPTYDAIIAGKSSYLNTTFFYVRAAIYFAIWIGLALLFRKKSMEQDDNGNPAISLRLARIGAPGLVLFGLSITFAAFDWMMSLDPHWFSTMFGVTYFAGSEMAFLALLAIVCMFLNKKGLLKDAVNSEHYHDIGKLMFAFMVFWSYVNFSQYFLIQYADIPEETMWFKHRMEGNWPWIGATLVVGHFIVPFAFLLSRHMKRNRLPLAIGATFLIVMHWFDMKFIIQPTYSHGGFYFHPFDAGTLIGILGIFLGLMFRNIGSSNLLPTRDPRLKESLKFQNL